MKNIALKSALDFGAASAGLAAVVVGLPSHGRTFHSAKTKPRVHVTKFGFAPAYDPSLGVQTPLTSGIGPVPDALRPGGEGLAGLRDA